MNNYQNQINTLYSALTQKSKIGSAKLDCLDTSTLRPIPSPPSLASSEFLINDQQGKWAETIVQNTINEQSSYNCVPYGEDSDDIAGTPAFEKFYETYQKELDTIGKKPDRLLFDPKTGTPENFHSLPSTDQLNITKKAILGLEVRSSARLKKSFTPSTTTKSLSFTVKLEDLRIVKNWIDTYGVPHYYVQVLFDEVHIISFEEILNVLVSGTRWAPKQYPNGTYSVKNEPKNQFKTTFQIHLSHGKQLGNITKSPSITAIRKELVRGRLLHYIRFEGGVLNLDLQVLDGIVEEARNAV